MRKNAGIVLMIVLLLWGFVACERQKAGGATLKQSEAVKSEGEAKMVFDPVVAGQFYTSSVDKLKADVDGYLRNADVPNLQGDVFGVIAPHAGYVYSGPVAGYSFKAVQGKRYDAVVVIGLSHRVPGTVSVLDYDEYNTPLGTVPIDRALSQKLIAAAPWIDDDEQLFSMEHSLEVELPFLQRAIPDLKVVMVSMRSGSLARSKELAKILDTVFDGKNVLFVASSDMSHFHDYDTARTMDLATLGLLQTMDTGRLEENFASRKGEMCGSGPVMTLLELFRLRGGKPDGVKVLNYMNSGDTSGDKSRVVGYGSVALVLPDSDKPKIEEPKPEQADNTSGDYLTADDKKELLSIARKTVKEYIATGKRPEFDVTSTNLLDDGAAFVTLHKSGHLRGCIGQIEARMPLWQCVRDMAIAAATQDPRFPKVQQDEVGSLDIEISVLTKPVVCENPETVEVGRHGLIMERGYNRGLLLPQVPGEWGWDRETYLSQTCRKAGMPGDCWKDKATVIKTFEAIVFSED